MKFTIYQESRAGKRANNEDRLAHCYSRDSLLMVVADGMGGHYFGEVAAQIAVQTLTESFQRQVTTRIRDPFLFLQTGMLNAHRAILDFAGKHQLQDSPRTTCVACIVQNNIAYWAHSGDSRLYLLRKGRALAQTKDHSRVRLLLEQGIINEEQASTHPDRNKIYGCLGGQQTPEIEFSHKTTLEAEDVLVLCTDGAWNGLPGNLMAVALKTANLMHAVPTLLAQAETRCGPQADNLSMIAVRWQDSYVDESSAGGSLISTKSMPRETVTTRLDEFGRNPRHKTELSEEEIELAIEEIRSTIQKYAK
ncbi:MAG: serine/threonine-protein phosphatase [Candidatus Accumulibacter meliphilus]|jgi:serine/threonine protein phosphatase PrpC|uniref:Serine/threonine-protein phosphatase n=1 Tax=Candidatus Accumulibacter meliphilus TaxID=2211374 RepID=A0A369XNS9_9PROT|nr:MAG: serine/threonine-protein phosphatase [Candidatus Accumulibacter meliphilus]